MLGNFYIVGTIHLMRYYNIQGSGNLFTVQWLNI